MKPSEQADGNNRLAGMSHNQNAAASTQKILKGSCFSED